MLIVPRQPEVRLAYAARTWADRLGRSLFLAVDRGGCGLARRSSRRAAGRPPRRPRRGRRAVQRGAWRLLLPRILPLAIVAGLASLRFAPAPRPAVDVTWLDEGASRAFAEERWETAAEYARHAIDLLGTEDPRRSELLCLRGEALLRAGQPRLAVLAFAPVVEAGSGPVPAAGALLGSARARGGRGRGGRRRLAAAPCAREHPSHALRPRGSAS